MARSTLRRATIALWPLVALVTGQTTSSIPADGLGPSPTSTTSVTEWSTTIDGTPTFFRSVFTIPASADEGVTLIPNVEDPEAVNAQNVCPGYKAYDVKEDDHGLSATLRLAGQPCNVYGNDIETLNLKVEYQAANRLAINISPANIVREDKLSRTIAN
jgi:alpha-glucosidase